MSIKFNLHFTYNPMKSRIKFVGFSTPSSGSGKNPLLPSAASTIEEPSLNATYNNGNFILNLNGLFGSILS
jgi:hypothetical protein